MQIHKVLLVYPGIVSVGFKSFGRGGMDTNWISLGLAYIGAYLKQRGYAVEIIDLRAMNDWNDFEKNVQEKNPDIIGVYWNSPNFNNALQCCSLAKKLGKIVVAGGPHATVCPQELVATQVVDYVITGEGEISFCELIEALQSGQTPSPIIQGKPVPDLDAMPFPDRDLYDIARLTHPVGNFPYLDNGLIMLTSRGCPFNCAFCQPLSRKMFGTQLRYRSVTSVLKEISYIIKKYGVRYISFQDDTFTVRKDWVLELCGAIEAAQLRFQWSAQSRVDTFDSELAVSMRRAGCSCVFFGFESGSQRILDFLNKGITVEQSLQAAKLCHEHGLIIFADVMVGIPTETEKDLQATLALVKAIRPEIFSPTYFTPIPGCQLYEYCNEHGLMNVSSYEDFTRNPFGAKIKGINYCLVDQYVRKMCTYVPKWYQESYFRKVVLDRWRSMWHRGYRFEVLKEIKEYSLPKRPAIRPILKKIFPFLNTNGSFNRGKVL